MEVFGEAIVKPTLGLTDVDQLTSRAADAIDEFEGGAGDLCRTWNDCLGP